MLCITNNSIKHQLFVYTQLNDQIVLFQTIQFSKSRLFPPNLNVKQFNLTYRWEPIRCYHSEPGGTWEWGQWRGTKHSPKLQHYWNLTIRLCTCSGVVGVFYSPNQLGCLLKKKIFQYKTKFKINIFLRRKYWNNLIAKYIYNIWYYVLNKQFLRKVFFVS